MQGPCLNCESRCDGCHSKCEKYAAYRENVEKIRKIKEEYMIKQSYFSKRR